MTAPPTTAHHQCIDDGATLAPLTTGQHQLHDVGATNSAYDDGSTYDYASNPSNKVSRSNLASLAAFAS